MEVKHQANTFTMQRFCVSPGTRTTMDKLKDHLKSTKTCEWTKEKPGIFQTPIQPTSNRLVKRHQKISSYDKSQLI